MPRKPGSAVSQNSRIIEVINGVQMASGAQTIEILDLHTGKDASWPLDARKAPQVIAGLRAGMLRSHGWLGKLLSGGLRSLPDDSRVTVADLREALAAAPYRPSPAFPVPSRSRVVGVCFPLPWEEHQRETSAHLVVAVILALAWRDGRAYEIELEGDLAERLGSPSTARAAMTLALRRSDGNIRPEGAGNFAIWRMREEWTRTDPNRDPRGERKPHRSGELDTLFDDDIDG